VVQELRCVGAAAVTAVWDGRGETAAARDAMREGELMRVVAEAGAVLFVGRAIRRLRAVDVKGRQWVTRRANGSVSPWRASALWGSFDAGDGRHDSQCAEGIVAVNE
jgi:hypothetical protein